jgi:hypothetical protein
LPTSAYAEQFALARQVEQERAAVHQALNDAKEFMKRLTDEKAKARLGEIADVAPEEQWWLAPASTTSLRYLDAKLQELAGAVDGADAAPTPDVRESWAKLKAASDSTLEKWRSFIAYTH